MTYNKYGRKTDKNEYYNVPSNVKNCLVCRRLFRITILRKPLAPLLAEFWE